MYPTEIFKLVLTILKRLSTYFLPEVILNVLLKE